MCLRLVRTFPENAYILPCTDRNNLSSNCALDFVTFLLFMYPLWVSLVIEKLRAFVWCSELLCPIPRTGMFKRSSASKSLIHWPFPVLTTGHPCPVSLISWPGGHAMILCYNHSFANAFHSLFQIYLVNRHHCATQSCSSTPAANQLNTPRDTYTLFHFHFWPSIPNEDSIAPDNPLYCE